MIRGFAWLLRAALFLVLLGFALSNVEPVSLQFFGIPQFEWRAPLVVILLAVFTAGALLGVLATMSLVMRRHRELSLLRSKSVATGSKDVADDGI
ncbi:MAG: lipopolysaccharide assembly LapA domain-containing protein [Burkholderiales bacterium]|jgi:putative membrane protein